MKGKISKKRVLVAMSGGVDSSVAAALLVRSGKYDVTGAFMVNYDVEKTTGGSCWLPDYRDALRVAAALGIPCLKFNFTAEYQKFVLEHVYREYEKGRTPNPDILCNKFVKFGSWLEKAEQLGFDFLATGHYARIGEVKSKKFKMKRYELLMAKDANKDQTYFLNQLNQKQLARTLFPLGNLTKPEVRRLAKKFALPTAYKEESMGICFVGEVPMKEFLAGKIQTQPGNVVTTKGEIVARHEGLAFYTIGQRHLGIRNQESGIRNDKKALYVVAKHFAANELVVGDEDNPLLYSKEIKVTGINWISGQEPKFPLKCQVRLRHRQPLVKCEVRGEKGQNLVRFNTPERAVTAGQFAVFYKNGECLGGGEIV